MAILIVEGKITRTFYNGKGAEVTETFKKRDGSEGTKRYALWFAEPHGLSEGDSGKFSGLHGDEVDEWTDKDGNVRHSVKRSVNNARIDAGRTQDASYAVNAARTAPSVTDPEPWAASGAESLPF